MTRLTIASYNLYEGGADNGIPGRRWRAQIGLLRDLRADILFVQELRGWDDNGFELFFQAEQELGMRGLFAAAPMVHCHLGIFLNPARAQPIRWDQRYTSMAWHAYAQARLRVAGIEGELEAVSMHLSPWSPEQRLVEASLAAQNIGKAIYGMLVGDANSVPPGDPEPPWDQMPQHKRAQAIIDDGGSVRADRRVGERLARAGLVDVARRFADRTGTVPDCTGDWFRCDQMWVTRRLAECVTNFETVETGASDHRLIRADLEIGGLA